MNRKWEGARPVGWSRSLSIFAVLLVGMAATLVAQSPGVVIGVGMAWDASDHVGPARIAYLYDDFNSAVLAPGDVILQYRGYPVVSGADLYDLVLSLPDVAPGQPVPMVTEKEGNPPAPVAPTAKVIEPKVVDVPFPNRLCVEDKGVCLCSKIESGATCVRTIRTVYDDNGKVVSTSACCTDGNSFCNPPEPKKKGK